MERTEADPRSIGLLQEVQLGPRSSSPITRSHQRASADLRWSNTPRDKDVKTARKASAPVTSPMIRKQWVGNALSDLYFWQLASPTSRGYVVIWWQTSPASMISNCWVHEQQDDSFLFGYEAHSHPDENEEQITNAWKLWLRQNISSHVQLLLQLRDMCKGCWYYSVVSYKWVTFTGSPIFIHFNRTRKCFLSEICFVNIFNIETEHWNWKEQPLVHMFKFSFPLVYK